MVYRVLGLMSGSSLDGLDLALVEFQSVSGKWQFNLMAADCYPYSAAWVEQLKQAHQLSAREYLRLHADYGHYLAAQVKRFVEEHHLDFQVQLIASHGHTVFHEPDRKMTSQLGDGAALAGITGIHTVSDLRAMDVALGGQGAPVVPIGEMLLWPEYPYLLNLGGIANLSVHTNNQMLAFDVCPANRVLNMLAQQAGKSYDVDGDLARSGTCHPALLEQLNGLPYYRQEPPKSLANDFGTDVVYPLLQRYGLSVPDACRTYTEHIITQIVSALKRQARQLTGPERLRMLVTGGGAQNLFMAGLLRERLAEAGIDTEVPDPLIINYKEAIVMSLMGLLRWREEVNVLASVTGASRNSIGGALWMGNA